MPENLAGADIEHPLTWLCERRGMDMFELAARMVPFEASQGLIERGITEHPGQKIDPACCLVPSHLDLRVIIKQVRDIDAEILAPGTD